MVLAIYSWQNFRIVAHCCIRGILEETIKNLQMNIRGIRAMEYLLCTILVMVLLLGRVGIFTFQAALAMTYQLFGLSRLKNGISLISLEQPVMPLSQHLLLIFL